MVKILKIYLYDVITSVLYFYFSDTQRSLYNCQDAYKSGNSATVILPIYVSGLDFINVRCDMVTDGGGWIVFQRRVDASVDFYRGWQDYKNGFGDLNGNFWLGLEKLHKLASPGKGAMLRVDMKHFRNPDSVKHAEYRDFEILSESDGYRLKLSGFSGNAGDALSEHSNCQFSTKDQGPQQGCATQHRGAWWYRLCYESNLNGLFPENRQSGTQYMSWFKLYNSYGGIIFSEMKLKYSLP